MISFPKKLLLALDAVLYISYNSRLDAVSSKEIAENLGVQLRYLEHLLQHFVHEGVLKSARGPKGGYLLAKERRKITLGDVMDSYNRMENLDTGGDGKIGTKLGAFVLKPVMEQASARMRQELDSITLETLCVKAEALGLGQERVDQADFVI